MEELYKVMDDLLEVELQMNAAISTEEVMSAIKRNRDKKYSAVYVTSPTYEGIVSDVRALAFI